MRRPTRARRRTAARLSAVPSVWDGTRTALMHRQTPRAYAALHGFASSPRSKKNLALKEAFEARSLVLHRPDLNQPSFGTLSFAAMLAELDRLDAAQGGPRWSMVGSSLGGYVAALWAAAHPERVERLVLLCPAFELGQRWSTLATPAELEQWRETGSQPFEDATGKTVPLHYAFVREATGIEPMPSPRCPTLVIHGSADTRVPIESSRRFVLQRWSPPRPLLGCVALRVPGGRAHDLDGRTVRGRSGLEEVVEVDVFGVERCALFEFVGVRT